MTSEEIEKMFNNSEDFHKTLEEINSLILKMEKCLEEGKEHIQRRTWMPLPFSSYGRWPTHCVLYLGYIPIGDSPRISVLECFPDLGHCAAPVPLVDASVSIRLDVQTFLPNLFDFLVADEEELLKGRENDVEFTK